MGEGEKGLEEGANSFPDSLSQGAALSGALCGLFFVFRERCVSGVALGDAVGALIYAGQVRVSRPMAALQATAF